MVKLQVIPSLFLRLSKLYKKKKKMEKELDKKKKKNALSCLFHEELNII